MELCFSELKTHVLSTALFIIEVDLQDDVINTFFSKSNKMFFFFYRMATFRGLKFLLMSGTLQGSNSHTSYFIDKYLARM